MSGLYSSRVKVKILKSLDIVDSSLVLTIKLKFKTEVKSDKYILYKFCFIISDIGKSGQVWGWLIHTLHSAAR